MYTMQIEFVILFFITQLPLDTAYIYGHYTSTYDIKEVV